jgi:LysM repeat protein
MKKRFLSLFVPGFFFITTLSAQDNAVIINPVIIEYINTYKQIAIAEMQRTGVPAAIKLAQGIHETEAGQSDLVRRSNNHFGIKCKDTWTGPSVRHTDDAPNECFRKYEEAAQSYRDHSDFLRGSTRYASLFELDPTDYEGWANGLKRAGYATNPKYPKIIIKLINDYKLQDYTMVALGKMTMEDAIADANKIETNPESATVAVKVEAVPEKTVEEVKVEIKEKVAEEIAVAEKPEPESIQNGGYPSGEFKINETRVIYAKKGTPFISIATQYDIPLARIFEFNDDMPEEEAVAFDQLIYLQRKRKFGNNEFHTVQPGETIYDIAQTEAIRLETLLAYNFLKETMDPAAGEKLYLRTKAPQMPALTKANSSIKQNQSTFAGKDVNKKNAVAGNKTLTVHTVQPGESIYAIARKYTVSAADIMSWNQLQSGSGLKKGQSLKIYK